MMRGEPGDEKSMRQNLMRLHTENKEGMDLLSSRVPTPRLGQSLSACTRRFADNVAFCPPAAQLSSSRMYHSLRQVAGW